MNMKPSTKTLFKMYGYSLFMSFIVLLFTSRYSFIFNNKFIMGDSVIYNLFSICPFIIEIMLFSIYLFLMYRISRLFLNKYSASLLIPLNAICICSSNIFKGGSVSEYTLVFVSICLYYYLRHFNKKMLTNKDMFICGLMGSLTLLLDYYLFGIWIGFILFIIIDYIVNRNQKRTSIKRITSFIVGFVIPICLVALVEWYFYDINLYLKEYFVNRFSFNLGLGTLKEYLTDLWNMGIINYWIVLLSPLLLCRIDTSVYCKIGLIVMLLLMILFIYINKIDNNNILVLSYFNIGMIGLFSFVDDTCKDFIKYYYKGIMITITILCFLFSIFASNVI